MKERILIIDDDDTQCTLLKMLVTELDYLAVTSNAPEEAIELVSKERFDAVLTDLEMQPIGGVEVCARIAERRPDLPVILVTGVGSLESAVEAMRAGAYDFLAKPVAANVLALALKRAITVRQLREEVETLRESPPHAEGWMIGKSPAVDRVRDLVERVGPSDAAVLITGETGTGKELVARALHAASERKEGPFVAINCAAVPANLLESELFGHARGAFTDAKNARDGLFVQATGGTLFLDEIGEMPLEMQAKLLRALQERTVRPVGSNNEVAFDTRIVAATHRDLDREMTEGRFREDLYYRVNVVKIAVPPLRDRGNDVLLLANHFLQRASHPKKEPLLLSPQIASLLLAYDWPGNVRELENCMERAVALARHGHLSVDDLPERVRDYRPTTQATLTADVSGGDTEILTLDELERRYILRALKILGGNRSRAATLLGLDRRTLYRRLEKYAAGETGPVSAIPPSGGAAVPSNVTH